MYLITCLRCDSDSPETKLRLEAIAYCCLQLRDAISFFSRVHIEEAEIVQCKNACQHFFNANVLFFNSITPTIWTIGYAIPRHMQILFDKYSLGLGLNSMQGREAKHVRLAQYARHSTKSMRWFMVLRHDYMANVWVRMSDPMHTKYKTYKWEYIPKQVGMENICYCGLPLKEGLDSCTTCSSAMYSAIKKSAEFGSLAPELAKLIKLRKV